MQGKQMIRGAKNIQLSHSADSGGIAKGEHFKFHNGRCLQLRGKISNFIPFHTPNPNPPGPLLVLKPAILWSFGPVKTNR
jgi:hypothetical protein